MTLRPIGSLRGRAGRFAHDVLRRYAQVRGCASTVDTALVPLRRAARARSVVLRHTVELRPAVRLALATAPGMPSTTVDRRDAGRRDAVTARFERIVRLALTQRELRIVDLRVAREALVVLERLRERSTRIEPGAPMSTVTSAGAGVLPARRPERLPASAPAPFATRTSPAEPAGRQRSIDRTTVAEPMVELPTHPRELEPARAAQPAFDVEQLTDSVLDAIDRRVVARRERQDRR